MSRNGVASKESNNVSEASKPFAGAIAGRGRPAVGQMISASQINASMLIMEGQSLNLKCTLFVGMVH